MLAIITKSLIRTTVVPTHYRPFVDRLPTPYTAADFQVPNMFFLVIYDSLYRRFPIPPFSAGPESGGIGGVNCNNI